MPTKAKPGRPRGEVHAGFGFDEKLKRLAELFDGKRWSFTTEEAGVVDAALLKKLAQEQEADQSADAAALSNYQMVHEPVMKRHGERGAVYSSALAMARTAAKGNRDLLKILDELKIRPGAKKKAPAQP